MTNEHGSRQANDAIPFDVLEAYELGGEIRIERLGGGLVNEAILVSSSDNKSVFRKLSPLLDPSLLTDTTVIGDHLYERGWEAPRNLPTTNGDLYVKDGLGSIWHRMNFIGSDGRTPAAIQPSLSSQVGELLGGWHITMRELDYVPQFSMPHFHDTAWQAHKTEMLIGCLPDNDSRAMAKEFICAYRRLPTVIDQPPQIIHGDPKLDNMLFRDGTPFTLIDFDTIMYDQPWTDVGDFLRSLTGKLMGSAGVEPAIDDFIKSYHESGEVAITRAEAIDCSLYATARIALELGMRYLCDIVDGDKYFSWNRDTFSSRRDNHYHKANLQRNVAQLVLQLTKS